MTVHNTVAGATAGTTVQARDIYGGITLPAQPPPPVPRQLPRRRALIDRVRDTELLTALLRRADPPPILITGPPGIGKTALALHLLHTTLPPGGQLYADLGAHSTTGPAHPEDVTARWLRALGAAVPADPEEARGLLRTLTAERAVAMLLDNAADAAQVSALLPADGSLVVITTRTPPAGLLADGAHHHRLRPLPPPDAHQLLAATAGPAANGQDLATLAKSCHGVPLALALAGARLAAGHTPTAAVPAAGPPENAVTHALDQAYQALTPTTARFYRTLGVLPLPSTRIDPGMAAAAAGLDPAATELHLTALTKAGLAAPADDGMYDLVATDGRRHAAALGRQEDSTGATDKARHRALDWLVAEFAAAGRVTDHYRRRIDPQVIYPPPHRAACATTEQALAWLRTRSTYLRPALEAADAYGLDYIVSQLVYAAWPLILRERDYGQWIWMHDLAIPAARNLADAAPRTRTGGARLMLRELYGARAAALRAVGRHTEAIEDCHSALASAKREADETGQAQALHNLGACAQAAGAPILALIYLSRALERRCDLHRARDAGVTRLLLGVVEHELGNHPAALTHLHTARRQLEDADDALNASRAQAWWGRVLATVGVFDDADKAFAAAREGFREQGADLWEARTLLWEGESAAAQDRKETAIALLHQARALCAGSLDDAQRVDAALHRLDADPTEPTAVLAHRR